MNRSGVSRNARHVALFLARYGSFPLAFPKIETVAKAMGVSYSTAYRGLRELREAGLLRSYVANGHRGQTSNDYYCVDPSNVGAAPTHSEGPAPPSVKGPSIDSQILKAQQETQTDTAAARPTHASPARERDPDPAAWEGGPTAPIPQPVREAACAPREAAPRLAEDAKAVPAGLVALANDEARLAQLDAPPAGVAVPARHLARIAENFSSTICDRIADLLRTDPTALAHPDAARKAVLRMATETPKTCRNPVGLFRSSILWALDGTLSTYEEPAGQSVMGTLARMHNAVVTGEVVADVDDLEQLKFVAGRVERSRQRELQAPIDRENLRIVAESARALPPAPPPPLRITGRTDITKFLPEAIAKRDAMFLPLEEAQRALVGEVK